MCNIFDHVSDAHNNAAWANFAKKAVHCNPSKGYCKGGTLFHRVVKSWTLNATKNNQTPLCKRSFLFYDGLVRSISGLVSAANVQFLNAYC